MPSFKRKRLLALFSLGLLLIPADSDSGGSDSDSGSSDADSSASSADIAAFMTFGNPTNRQQGSSDDLSDTSSETSSEGNERAKSRRKRTPPENTEGLSDEELNDIPE